MSKSYPINEIFDSIQGEGYWTGTPATFIRLQECNLRCAWCDTKDTWPPAARLMAPAEIMPAVHFDHVIITGGEPLLHDLTDLFALLQTAGKKIHIETNGTQPWRNSYPSDVWITVSPKMQSDYQIHASLQTRVSEYKFVVDEDFDHNIIANYPFNTGGLIYLSPENVRPEMIQKALAIVYQYPDCRFMLQIHKLIGVQ